MYFWAFLVMSQDQKAEISEKGIDFDNKSI